MKRYLVAALMLTSLGARGQDSSKPAPAQNHQDMPGMQMPQKPTEPSAPQQNKPTNRSNENMPGMQIPTGSTENTESKTGPTYSLEQLQQIATQHNPTLKQAVAEIRAAEGRKRQAGLYPNPTVGYLGEQIRGGSQGGGEQGGFIQQNIVLGGKLGAAKEVMEQERLQAEAERDEQALRVQNAVAMGYYQTLGAQETVRIRERMLKLAQDAVATTQQLLNVGQADEPDLLQAEVEAGQEEISLVAAQQRQQMQWTSLASVVGQPTLPFGNIAGKLEDMPQLDAQQWLDNILQNSPAVKIAELSAARARAKLISAKREPIPDLQLRVGLQQNREPLAISGRPIGLQGIAEVGVRIPIFNRNQGSIQAAEAEVNQAELERERIQLLLRERSSATFQDYNTAKSSVERYRTELIPRAEKAYKLYMDRYNNMAAAYPQVLISQRTLLQLQTDYIASLQSLWVDAIALKGFLLSDGLEKPTPPSGIDRPVRETNLPIPR